MSIMKVWSTLNPPPIFRRATLLPVLFCLVIVVAAQGPFEPARFQAGSPPVYPPRAVGWGHEWLQVSLDSSGEVTGTRLLRGASTFGLALQMAVQGWSFTPAREADEPIGSEVLVAAIFRPATLYDPPRLGQPVSCPSLSPRHRLPTLPQLEVVASSLSRWRWIAMVWSAGRALWVPARGSTPWRSTRLGAGGSSRPGVRGVRFRVWPTSCSAFANRSSCH